MRGAVRPSSQCTRQPAAQLPPPPPARGPPPAPSLGKGGGKGMAGPSHGFPPRPTPAIEPPGDGRAWFAITCRSPHTIPNWAWGSECGPPCLPVPLEAVVDAAPAHFGGLPLCPPSMGLPWASEAPAQGGPGRGTAPPGPRGPLRWEAAPSHAAPRAEHSMTVVARPPRCPHQRTLAPRRAAPQPRAGPPSPRSPARGICYRSNFTGPGCQA